MEEVEVRQLMQSCTGEGWFGHSWNINLYRGCCHGCIYCDSRSSCYQVHEFDRVRCKKDALKLLESELRSHTRKGVVGMGAMSDPYNPFEKDKRLTRGALELLLRHGYGVSIATKSDLIVRDADLLSEIARFHPALAKITVTAAEDKLSRLVEPHAPPSSVRFHAIEQLSKRGGIFPGVLLMPVLPFIEDNERNLRGIVARAADCGARFIYPQIGVTLRANQRQWYYERLDERFPGLREKYEETYGERYDCASPRAAELYAVLEDACRERGVLLHMPEIIAASRKPYGVQQLSLF